MPYLNWDYFSASLSLAWTVALGVELFRLLGGFYSGLLWYAVLIKFWERTTIYTIAIAAFIAYALGGGVTDALNAAVHDYTVIMPPGLALFLWGGLSVIAFMAAGDVVAMLAWAVTRRRMPWRYFAYADRWFQVWFADLIDQAAPSCESLYRWFRRHARI